MFKGDWVRDESGPKYTNSSCRFIESHQNCMLNGRPDSDYLYWRWKPKGCDLPRFDAAKFLEMMRNKAWALVGDSISRNHVQSILCLLSTVSPFELRYKSMDFYYDRLLSLLCAYTFLLVRFGFVVVIL